MGCYFSCFTTDSRDVSDTETFPDMYSDIHLIHKGSRRRVYRCTSGGKILCCKVIPILSLSWRCEYSLMLYITDNKLPSPKFTNIVKKKNFIYMFYEYIEGIDMFEYLEKNKFFNEKYASNIIRNLISILLKYHEKYIWHLDIKPENILCKNGDINNLCLIDFGQSVICREDILTNVKSLGTQRYAAPELSYGICSAKTDVWSIGVIAYILYMQSYPSLSLSQRKKSILKAEGSYLFVDFIKKCLEYSMIRRISLKELLVHPWISNI